MTTTKTTWTRKAPKWYAVKDDPAITVGTYCDCHRDWCGFRYAVFTDTGFGEESVDGSFAPTLAEAKRYAEENVVGVPREER